MTEHPPTTRVLPDEPAFRPLERFWPYAELDEQPSEEELALLHPELRAVIFGAPTLPFSISVEFPAFEGTTAGEAVKRAAGADEYVTFEREGRTWHRARFYPGARPADLRDMYNLVADVQGSEVLIDDCPVPYARELWLPLVWLLIR
jgi:hypothetical protein